ncbi:MAG: VOC family protein [Bacteroidia bacterium]
MERGAITFGGVFFKCQDKNNLIAWYKKHLGIPLASWGAVFPFENAYKNHPEAYNVFSPFSADTNYFEPSASPFMFNFIVENLDALLVCLSAEGIKQVKPLESSEFGKFAWILDCEGNKVELWQPVKSSN